MAFERGGGILLQFPVGNAAGWAGAFEPFVSEPTCGPAVSGIVGRKCFVAVGGNPDLITAKLNLLNTVQDSFSRRP